MASELDIARRAVAQGLLAEDQLDGCLAERRRLLQDGLDLSLRDLLFDRGLLDAPRWDQLLGEDPQARRPAPLAETASEVEPPPPEPAGEVLGDYRVLGELGRGAMGVVYEALQEKLGRRVALKVLPATQALQGVARERFLREAKATAALRHPGIVPIYDIAAERGVHFFAMELLEGRSLRRILEEGGPLAPEEAARVARAAAEALAYAHGEGVIHRDVKPDNIIVREDGTPVLTDFGLALRERESALTRAGTIVGTPLYMAPEQAQGRKELDARVDVYALGATLYELLAGKPPFHGAEDTAVLIDWIERRDPAPLAQLAPQVPAPLRAIVEVALEKEPARRYASAAALAEDLGRFLEGHPILARPPGRLERLWRSARRRPRLAGGLALALVLTVVGGLVLRLVARRWRADGLVLQALHLSDRGELDAAESALDQALQLIPELAEAHYQRGELLLRRGKQEQARAAFDRALEHDPDHVSARLSRGLLAKATGDLQRARADLQVALEQASQSDPRPQLALGLLLAESAEGRDGLVLLRRGLSLARDARQTHDPLYREAVLATGEQELLVGDASAAVAELEEAVRLEPESAGPQVLLGRALRRAGRLQAAVEAFSSALRRDPQHLEARELRGRCHRLLGHLSEAFQDLEAARARPGARLALGLLRFESVDHVPGALPRFADQEAIDDLEAAADDERLAAEDRAAAWTALGWLQLHASRPYRTRALERFDKALALDPQATGARLARGLVLQEWGRFEQAEQELKQAQGLEGGAYGALVGLARIAMSNQDLDRGLELLNQAIALAPERATAYGDRYRLRLERGDAGATEDRTAALARRGEQHQLQPFSALTDPFQLAEDASAQGFADLARAMSSDGSDPYGLYMSRSLAWLERALVYDPRSPTASARLASVLYLNGHFRSALTAFTRAQHLDPLLIDAGVLRAVILRDQLADEGDPQQALGLLDELPLEQVEPRLQSMIHLERAKCLLALDRPQEALQALDQAEQLSPERWALASLRARILTRQQDPQAEAAVQRASRLFYEGQRDPERGQLYMRAGGEQGDLHHDRGALHLLTRALEYDPLNAEAWHRRSKVYLRGPPNQLPLALVDSFVASELDPVHRTGRFLELEARFSRFAALVKIMDAGVGESLSQAPELPAGAFAHGFIAFYNGRLDEAEGWFTRAHELSQGRSYLSLCYRGACRMRAGRMQEARADLDQAEQVYPGGPVVRFWRACWLARDGQDSAALDELEQSAAQGQLYRAQLRNAPELDHLRELPRMQRLVAGLEGD